ncbi:MAG: hypothetical protein AB2A00_21425 [Myxococcota bacterium]
MRSLLKRGHLAAAAAVLLLLPAVARSTVVIQPSLEEMTQKSNVIIHAVVEEQTVTRGEEGKRILTLSRLRVTEGLKGAKTGDTITLYQVGGSEGGRVARVVGMNDFKVGEEVILFAATFIATDTIRFLQENRKAEVPAATLHPSGGWVVTYGIGLGKFAVVPGPNGSGPMAVEEVGDVAVARQVQGRVMAGTPVVNRQPLDAFKAEVRRMASTGRAP